MAYNETEAPELLSALAEEMSENPGMRFVDTLEELSEWYGAGEPELAAAADFAAAHPAVADSLEIYDPASAPEFIIAAYPGLVDALDDLAGAPRPDLARALAQAPESIVEPLASVGDSPAALDARGRALAAAMAAMGREAFEGGSPNGPFSEATPSSRRCRSSSSATPQCIRASTSPPGATRRSTSCAAGPSRPARRARRRRGRSSRCARSISARPGP